MSCKLVTSTLGKNLSKSSKILVLISSKVDSFILLNSKFLNPAPKEGLK